MSEALVSIDQFDTTAPLQTSAVGSPYLFFHHIDPTKARSAAVIAAHGDDTPEQCAILDYHDGTGTARLDDCNFLLTPCVFQHFSRIDSQNNVLETKLQTSRDQDFKEHIECVVIVIDGEKLIPARLTVRKAQCPCVKQLDKEIKAYTGDGKPWMQFVGEMYRTDKRSPKGPYTQVDAHIRPIAEWEAEALAAELTTDTFKANMSLAIEGWQKRCGEIKQKVR